MKIEKLIPTVTDYQIVDKVNEIIELLNNSFITQDKDVAILDNLSTAIGKSSTILNGTFQMIQDNNITEPEGLFDNIKCPKCGAKYFEVGPSVNTLVYYSPVIKDGVNIHPDRNISTTTYTCCECGHKWKE